MLPILIFAFLFTFILLQVSHAPFHQNRSTLTISVDDIVLERHREDAFSWSSALLIQWLRIHLDSQAVGESSSELEQKPSETERTHRAGNRERCRLERWADSEV